MSEQHPEDRRRPDERGRPESEGPRSAGPKPPPGPEATETAGSPESAPPSQSPRITPQHLAEMDEQALRRLMQDLVQDIDPDPNSLDRLQRAVPQRRRRRRQVLLGGVTTLALVGLGLPLLVGNGVVPGLSDRSTTTANHTDATGAEQTPASESEQPTGEVQTDPGTDPSPSDPADPREEASPSAGTDTSTTDPNETLVGVSPSCDGGQLEDGGPSTQAADETGRIYGAFRVVNVSSDSCTVSDPGLMAALPRGRAQTDGVQVLDHTGDASVMGLPAPQEWLDQLVLMPGQAYEVKFVWVPQEGGGVTGCEKSTLGGGDSGGANGTSPQGNLGEDPDTGGTGDESGTSPDTGGSGDDPAPPASSVLLDYTPGAGNAWTSQLVLDNACAGTVYRTGMLSAV